MSTTTTVQTKRAAFKDLTNAPSSHALRRRVVQKAPLVVTSPPPAPEATMTTAKTQRAALKDLTNDPSIHVELVQKAKKAALVTSPPPSAPEDVLIAIYPENMDPIVRGEKTWEFRKRRADNVRRFWFYTTAPVSAVKHVCEISPVRTRNPGDEPLPEGPVGNKEFNEFHPDWDLYDYAYEIRSVYELEEPVELEKLESQYGWKGIPKGLPLAPLALVQDIAWQEQRKVW